MKSKNPMIEEYKHSGKNCLKFTFSGVLKERDAKSAIKIWKDIFHLKSNEKFILIWECLNMKGYDSQSRIIWQNALKEMKPQIHIIWLISTTKLIRVGAQIMSLFTSMNIKAVESEDQIVI